MLDKEICIKCERYGVWFHPRCHISILYLEAQQFKKIIDYNAPKDCPYQLEHLVACQNESKSM